jgi:hypothetical protein
MDLHPALMRRSGAFSSSNVEYLVVGGWAVSVHSEPRFTKDLDVLIGTADDNLERAAQALKLFGAPDSIVAQAAYVVKGDEFLPEGSARAAHASIMRQGSAARRDSSTSAQSRGCATLCRGPSLNKDFERSNERDEARMDVARGSP